MTGVPVAVEAQPARSTLTRIIRVLAVGIGAAGSLFVVVLAGVILQQWSHYELWWNVIASAAFLGASVALALCGVLAPPAVVRATAAIGGWLVLAVAALSPLGAVGRMPDGGPPWILDVIAVATTMIALGSPSVVAWGAVVVAGLVAGVVRTLTGYEGSVTIGLENGVQTTTFCAVFVLLAVAVLQAGRMADDTLAAARAETATAVSARARAAVRERIDALVHDRVLATLLLAGRATTPGERALAATQASDALEELTRHADPERPREDAAPKEFVWAVQGLVRDLDPECQFGYELSDGHDARGAEDGDARPEDEAAGGASPTDADVRRVPAEIVDALTAATLEALRNSLRHADRPDGLTLRAVHVEAGPDRVVVTVLDTGAGFDVGRVATTRFGIESSIRARMRAVGGSAQIVSRVGQGTRVVITWTRPEGGGSDGTPPRGRHAHDDSGLARVARPLTMFDVDFWTVAASPPPRITDGGIAGRFAAILPPGFGTDAIGRGSGIHGGLLFVLAVLQVVTVVVLSFASNPAAALSWSNLLAIVVYAASVTVLALPGPMPIQRETAWAVVMSCFAISLLVPLTLPHGEAPGYQAWHFGANTLMLLVLGLRGRILASWIAMAGMSALTVWWCLTSDLTLADAVSFLVRNIATLAVGSGVSILMRRAITRTIAVREALDRQYSAETAELAASEEQRRILQRFESAALPALRAIATEAEPTPEERREWLSIEAMLRDRIRARSIDLDPLRSAVHRARERDLRVVLLDDARDRTIPADELTDVLAWAAERVERAEGPEVTVRLSVSKDDVLSLTVVGDELAEERRIGDAAERAEPVVGAPPPPRRRGTSRPA